MTSSLYTSISITTPYYTNREDIYWDNFHTIFLLGDEQELQTELKKLNHRLEFHTPFIDGNPKNSAVINRFIKPDFCFKTSPHILINDDRGLRTRQYFIEDYLDKHLGWRDKRVKNSIYDHCGYDVFLVYKELSNSVIKWLDKPAVFGLEVLTVEEYAVWLNTHPGNQPMRILTN